MSSSPAHKHGSRRRLLRVLVVVLATAGLFELTCRFLVFSDLPADWTVARRLRTPALFGDDLSSDLYWEMHYRNQHGERRPEFARYNPDVGYTSPEVSPLDFEHSSEEHLDGRRPILLFGDSFAESEPVVQGLADFETLFELGPLAGEYALLNYGTRGHGLDQILLVMRHALERHAHLDPIVIVSFLVDEDLDRCVLSFRGGPKPRFRLEGGALSPQRPQAPRVARYFDEHATRIPSVSLLLLRRALLGEAGSRAAAAVELEKQELSRAILQELAAELRARELSSFFLLFHGVNSIEDPAFKGWREPLVVRTLDELAAPWTSVRPAFAAHLEQSGLPLQEYFIQLEGQRGHYDSLGNQVAFQALLDGLRDHLGVGSGGSLAGLVDFGTEVTPRGCRSPRCIPRIETMPAKVVDAVSAAGLVAPLWVLDPCSDEAYDFEWVLHGEYAGFRSRAIVLSEPATAELVVRLSWLADERVLARMELRPGEPLREVRLDVPGVRDLRLRAQVVRQADCISRLFLDSVELTPSKP